MPKKRRNQEKWKYEGLPYPPQWDFEPEQIVIKYEDFQLIQKGIDSLPDITIHFTQNSEDVEKIIKWVKKNNLPGGWNKWYDIIGQTFIELLKLPEEKHKLIYAMYRESILVKLDNAINRLEAVKEEAEKNWKSSTYLKSIQENLTSCLIPVLEICNPKYIIDYIKRYKKVRKKLLNTKSRRYNFIKPHLFRLITAIDPHLNQLIPKNEKNKNNIKNYKSVKYRNDKIIFHLFKLFEYLDFNDGINENSKIERVRDLINKINKNAIDYNYVA